jgi:peptide/nickel transport system permease protein
MRIATMLLSLIGTLIAGGLIGATLVRFAPGYEVDERELDLRLSEESIAALRAQNGTGSSLPRYYVNFLTGLVKGEFGISRSQRRPVGEVIRERIPITLRTAGLGCALALLLGLAIAILALRVRALHIAASAATGLVLSIPAAAIGFIALWTGIGVEWAVASALTPKVFRYCVEILGEMESRGHVLIARAKGLSQMRILIAHIVRPALGELTALTGVVVSLAFGVAVPLEVICDVPGLGQLAWQSALARDLPVLVTLTLLITFVVKATHLAADSLRGALGEAAQ